MAIIDVVKCDMQEGELCYKFPSDNLRIGTQLVVYPSQTAFFVKGGAVCDEFTSGTYTIKTENIPLISKVINIPFGGETPFKADVWFINQIAKLDMPWGTPQPIQIEDPKYHIIVPLRSHGQYGMKVSNPRTFLNTLVGNLSSFTADKIDQYFKGRLITSLNALIAQQVVKQNISILDINSQLTDLSDICQKQLNERFEQYGISIMEFSIMSISFPQDDPSVVKLKEAKDLAAKISITGRDIYQMDRSFDVLEKAAANEGTGGGMAAMGAGLGVGYGMGSIMGNMASSVINTSPNTPPPIPNRTFHIAINGTQIPNQTLQQISAFLHQGTANADTLVWSVGMPNWVRIADVPELAGLVNAQTPPPLPNM